MAESAVLGDAAVATHTHIGQNEGGDAPTHAEKRHFGLRGYVLIALVAAVLLLPLLAIKYAIVFLGTTFPFETQFPHDKVPFYTEIAPGAPAWQRAWRYDLWWWLLALSMLRIGTVVGSYIAVSQSAMTGHDMPLKIMKWWTIIYGLADFVISFFYIITTYTRLCADVPICRNWDAEQGFPLATDSNANWIFIFLAWFSLAFTLVHIAYYNLFTQAHSRLDRAKQSEAKKDDDDEFV